MLLRSVESLLGLQLSKLAELINVENRAHAKADLMEPPKSQVISLPAADVTAPATTQENLLHVAYPVKKPEEEHSEFFIEVRASTLGRVRRKAMKLTAARFPWPEFLLGVSTGPRPSSWCKSLGISTPA
jgi:hypothetical protein